MPRDDFSGAFSFPSYEQVEAARGSLVDLLELAASFATVKIEKPLFSSAVYRVQLCFLLQPAGVLAFSVVEAESARYALASAVERALAYQIEEDLKP